MAGIKGMPSLLYQQLYFLQRSDLFLVGREFADSVLKPKLKVKFFVN